VSRATGRRRSPLEGSPYQQYLYSYPHKTAYRGLVPARSLEEVWAGEDRRALLLYVHVPFCEKRCGFCNLFTAANPTDAVVNLWLEALEREAAVVRAAVGAAGYARAAVGGGTPSFLSVAQLERVFSVMADVMGARLGEIPLSVEVSCESATPEKLELFAQRGVDRVSIGVQSFVESETRALLRPQAPAEVHAALAAIRESGVATLNLDLIYGIPGQTVASWEASLGEALLWRPEELYLYPLYVRPLTALSQAAHLWDDERLGLYRAGRALLLAQGYQQVSMRMFRRGGQVDAAGPAYRCQEDGMVGLGPGARSYTRALHYSQEWAVASRAVRGIIAAYGARGAADFAVASHGFVLDLDEQQRRDAILSVLADGLDEGTWRARFGTAPLEAVPELGALLSAGLLEHHQGRLRLTAAGLERSDAVGPYLHSARVDALMRGWEER
jgi:oxygen-independent coproporphyrinogen-3 oxidase